MAMSFVWELPQALLQNLLSLWLSARDIGRLDSAACHTVKRPMYLNAVSDSGTVIRKLEWVARRNMPLQSTFTEWAFKRVASLNEIDISVHFLRCFVERARYLAQCGIHVKKIGCGYNEDVIDWDWFVRGSFGDFCHYCPNITAISCPQKLATEIYTQIAERWPQLESITLGGRATGNELNLIGSQCQSLTLLDATSCKLSTACWAAFFTLCSPVLRVVRTRSAFTEAVCRAVAARCPQLRILNACTTAFTDSSLLALAEGCPQLQDIDLSHNVVITDTGLLAIAQHGSLTHLRTGYCRNLTDAALVKVAARCVNLVHIDISHFGSIADNILIAIGRSCPKLQYLSISDVRIASEEALQALARGCPELSELYASCYVSVGSELCSIARHCHHLRVIDLSDSEVPAAAVRAFATHCPELVTVKLCGLAVGDAEITALADGCPNLSELSIPGTSITEAGLRAVIDHCPKLHALKIGGHLRPQWMSVIALVPGLTLQYAGY